jgi:crotonobetainyl-CoA:carnitine CoA-transferase CaiB-like acyl-CoA transferase
LADEQVAHRRMVVSVEHPRYGTLREVGCPIKIDDLEPRYAPGAALGADTEPILSEWLGLTAAEIEALRKQRAI